MDIRESLEKQKAALAELSAQIEAIEQNDIIDENQKLTEHCEKLAARCENAERSQQTVSAENARLKTALYEQYYNEKLRLVTKYQQQLEIYFSSEAAGEQDRLTALGRNIEARINELWEDLRKNHVDLSDEIFTKLTALKDEAHVKIVIASAMLPRGDVLTDTEKAEYERLKEEALSDEQIAQLSKKNNLERIIGLNLLNIVGVILIIIGVIALGQFAYLRMGDVFRGMMLFVLGAVFLAAGEIINRKKPNIFSLGITAGGVGILYAALAVSYFALGIMNMYAALAVCVAVTALAFFLSTRYNTQILLTIALVGGYLPIFSIGPTRALLFSMMGYFVLLNLLALFLSFRRKWTVASFVGLGLNIIGTIYVSTLVSGGHPLTERVVETVYVTFAILIYTAIPLLGTYAAKTGFRKSDVILLCVNTFFGSLIMFLNINGAGWSGFLGLTSALFAALYLALGYVITRKFENAKPMNTLFYITGLVFFVLFVPLQFDYYRQVVFGWLVQGTALTVYGIAKEHRYVKLSGFITNGLALFLVCSGVVVDLGWGRLWLTAIRNHQWEYLAVTAASVIIMAAFIYKKTINSALQKTFKYCAAVNLWLYVLFLIDRIGLLYASGPHWLAIEYLNTALIMTVTLIFAVIYPRIRLLLDSGMEIISASLGGIGIFGILMLNLTSAPTTWTISEHITFADGYSAWIVAVATVILIAVGVIGAFSVYDLARRAALGRVLGVQYLPLMVSAYIVVIFTINLIRAYGLSFTSFWISVVYVVTALLWTIIGFMKRYVLLRRFGLGLALLSVAKLFLIDLAALTQAFRILSYFILGAILIAISYVYQYFSKRLDLPVTKDEQ